MGLIFALLLLLLVPSTSSSWTHIAGSSSTYAANCAAGPGARRQASSWTDGKSLFVFGGTGVDGDGNRDMALNDLWEYSIATATWTLRGGSCAGNARGTDFYPGARRGAGVWQLSGGDVYLFGGAGFDQRASGVLSDMWKFSANGGAVSFVGGPKAAGHAASATWPGARRGFHAFASTGCAATGERMYLFGGFGRGASDDDSTLGDLGDVWQYDAGANQWARVAGSPAVYATSGAAYGEPGVFASGVAPWPRSDGAVWARRGCVMYVFGGWGFNSATQTDGLYNDLWAFDCALRQWAYLGGQRGHNQRGVAGSAPASRYGAAAWLASPTTLALFGGYSAVDDPYAGYLNDLWHIDVSGGGGGGVRFEARAAGRAGPNWSSVHCARGVSDAAVLPGGRHRACAWAVGDAAYVFGGDGVSESSVGFMSDLFRLDGGGSAPAVCTAASVQSPLLFFANNSGLAVGGAGGGGGGGGGGVSAGVVVAVVVVVVVVVVAVVVAVLWRRRRAESAPPSTPTKSRNVFSPASPSSPTPLNPSGVEMQSSRDLY